MRIFRFIALLFIFFNSLFANVVLKAPNTFMADEPLVFSIVAIGDDAKFPKIDKIDGYKVQIISSNSSIISNNSNIIEKKSITYQLFPKNDVTIPAFLFEISGQEFKTKSKKVLMEKIKKTKSQYTDFTIAVDKKEVYVGEEFRLKLIFKYSKNLNVDALGLAEINFENFWHKALQNKSKRYELNNFIYQELEFLMFAQQDGELNIKPLRVDMQVVDDSAISFSFFSSGTKVYKIYSNDLNIKVKPLPDNLRLIGDFNINAAIDKQVVNQGDAISLKLDIDGYGNIDDLNDFKLYIENATIYENRPTITTTVKEEKSFGVYSKVFSIIANEDLTIPSFKIEYFDRNRKQKVVKETKSFQIKVKKQVHKKNQLIKPKVVKQESIKEVIVTKSSLKEKIVYFLFGFISCALIFGLYLYVIKSKKKKAVDEIPLIKKIKKANSKDELIKMLVPYLGKDSSLDIKIFQLEKLKDQKEFANIKKEILKVAKQLERGEKNENFNTILD